MNLFRRAWPYGTRYRVRVEIADATTLAVVGDEGPVKLEAFVLFGHKLKTLPALNSIGYVTFTKGGPMGGYWAFTES